MHPTYFEFEQQVNLWFEHLETVKKIGSSVPKKQRQLAEKEKPEKPGAEWKIRYRNELICTITEFKSALGKLSIFHLNNLTV